MAGFNIDTPFAPIRIEVEKGYEDTVEYVREWVYEQFGVPTPEQVQATLNRFEEKRAEIRRQINDNN